jgi:starch-binding outer membrane protein, SusD/RagB family
MKIMKMNQIIKLSALASLILLLLIGQGCKKFDYSEFNGPSISDDTTNATTSVLQTLVTGTEASSRQYILNWIDDVGVIGREHYRFSNSEPRYLSDLLGEGSATLNNNTFYITNPWASCYASIKTANVLISAARNSAQISDSERFGYYGYAQTMEAYQLLMCLDLTDANGIRVDVADPNNLGPILNKTDALTALAALLDQGYANFNKATYNFTSTLFDNTADDTITFPQFNRAMAARVAAYRQDWTDCAADLQASFMKKNGDLFDGVYHEFSANGNDLLNPAFFPQNATGELRCADTGFYQDILPNDDRINKAPLRDAPYSQGGLTSTRDVFIYPTNTAPIAIIRNEELILLDAEANLNLDNLNDFVADINIIREAHGLPDYVSGGSTADMNELVYEYRYSLAFEGHRWVDLRRWGLIDEIPIEREGDHVWSAFPIPLPESY